MCFGILLALRRQDLKSAIGRRLLKGRHGSLDTRDLGFECLGLAQGHRKVERIVVLTVYFAQFAHEDSER